MKLLFLWKHAVTELCVLYPRINVSYVGIIGIIQIEFNLKTSIRWIERRLFQNIDYWNEKIVY